MRPTASCTGVTSERWVRPLTLSFLRHASVRQGSVWCPLIPVGVSGDVTSEYFSFHMRRSLPSQLRPAAALVWWGLKNVPFVILMLRGSEPTFKKSIPLTRWAFGSEIINFL